MDGERINPHVTAVFSPTPSTIHIASSIQIHDPHFRMELENADRPDRHRMRHALTGRASIAEA